MGTNSNCCPVTDIRGKALVASVESLSAIGPQDLELLNDESLFEPSFIRTAPNAIFQRKTQFGQPKTKYFGETIKYTYKPQEMGDLLGNMYLKTTLPRLPEDPAGSNVCITFPAEFCEDIEPGQSLTVTNSELRKMKVGDGKTMIPYTDTAKVYNNDASNLIGNQDITYVPIGFIGFDNMILGNKIINQEVYKSRQTASLPVGDLFSITANVYTTETVTSNTPTIDGGMRNFELFNLNNIATKETKLFNPDSTGTINIDNLHLFSLGNTAISLTATGNYNAVTTTNVYAINPLITTIAPRQGNKFIFSNVNSKFEWSGVGTTPTNTIHDFSTNVHVNSNVLTVGGGTMPVGSDLATTGAVSSTGTNATVWAEAAVPTNVSIINKGYGYRPGELVNIDVAVPTTRFPWAPGDQNKTPLGGRDMLSHATIERIDPPSSVSDGTVLAQFGSDLSVVYHQEGSWDSAAGGANVYTNRTGFDTHNVNITTSGEYGYFGINPSTGSTDVGRVATRLLMGQGRNLLYRANYMLTPNSNITANANWNQGGTIVDESSPVNSTLSLYSNASDDNILTAMAGLNKSNGPFTTPVGMRFMRITLELADFNFDPANYKLDGSFFPLYSVTSPAGNIKITFGGAQSGSAVVPNFGGQILFEDTRVGGTTVLRNTTDKFWVGSNPSPPYNFPLHFWLNYGKIGPGPDSNAATYSGWSEPPNVLTYARSGNDISSFSLSALSDNLLSGIADSIPPDHDFINAMEYGGLIIKIIDPGIACDVYGAYTTHDLYKGVNIIGSVNAYSNNTTITYGRNWWDDADHVNGNTINMVNGTYSNLTNAFTTQEMANIVSNVFTQQAFPSSWSNVGYNILLYDQGAAGTGAAAARNANVYITPTVYNNTRINHTSNGYANVVTTIQEEGPIALQNKQLDISFYANNNTVQIGSAAGYASNIVHIENQYFAASLGSTNVTAQTIMDIREPYAASTINIASTPGGNVWTYYVNNYAEYTQGLSPVNTLQFEEPGYDIIFDDKWQLTGLGNTVSIVSHMGTFNNRVTGYRYSNTNSDFFITTNTSNIMDPYTSENYGHLYNLNSNLVSPQESYPGNNYPLSMLSITMSTSNRLPITYIPTDDYKDKLSLLPPTNLTMNVGSLNLWYNSEYTVYSGPTPITINNESIKTITGSSTNYTTNVAYTTGHITVFSNSVSNINYSFKTYAPDTNLVFHSYDGGGVSGNTMTLGTQTADLTLVSNTAYGNYLRSSNIFYNPTMDIGEGVYTNLEFDPHRYTPTFQFGNSVFFIGGGKKEEPRTSKACYKVDLAALTLPLTAATTTISCIPLLDFTFAFYGGTCTLDTDNNYVYLFGPNNTNDLYRIQFDPVLGVFVGSWVLISTTWYYTAVQGSPITYYNGKLWVCGGYFPTLHYGSKLYYVYSFDITDGLWSSTYYTTNASYPRRTRQVLLAGTSRLLCLANEASGGSGTADRILIFDLTNVAAGPTVVTKDSSASGSTFFWPAMYESAAAFAPRVGLAGGNQDVILYQSNLPADYSYVDTSTNTVYTQSISPANNITTAWDPDNEMTCGSMGNSIFMFGGNLTSGSLNRLNQFLLTSAAEPQFLPNNGTTPGDAPPTLVPVSEEYSNCAFVGTTSPGNTPIVTSGIYYSQKNVPFFTLTDNFNTDRTLECGIRRSNVYTAIDDSSRENKGQFNNFYLDTKTANNIVVNNGWKGDDSSNNLSQTTAGAGAVWAADAVNNRTIPPYVYASNIVFQSTTNAEAEYITFESGNVSVGVDERSTVLPVYNSVSNSNVQYSDMPEMTNNFFGYTVDGIVPYTSSNAGAVTITNSFNQYTTGNFINGYPSITACYDTDNIPAIKWNLTLEDDGFGGSNNAIAPPIGVPVTNVMINDNYRQYLPSQVTRTGRLDTVKFMYGSSRWCLPSSNGLTSNTLQYGLYRGNLMSTPTTTSTMEAGQRKLSLCAFETGLPGNQTEASKIEIYKYFASNTAGTYSSNIYTTERGFYDEIIMSFGIKTTASGNKDTLRISPGYGTSDINVPGTTATTKFDTVDVTFSNYNPAALSVNANIWYRHNLSTREVAVDKTVFLSADAYNMLSDPYGASGNLIITSTFNNGKVTSNLDYGTRPIDTGNTVAFSQNLWSTNLGPWQQTADSVGTLITNVAQENVYSEVFPVEICLQLYNPCGVYANKIGRAIIKNVTISIHGQQIEKLDDLWYITHDEIFKTDDDKKGLRNLINGGQSYLPTSPIRYGPVDLYVPLDLFFCRSRRTSSTEIKPKKVFDENRTTNPYLPLCAISHQELEIAIEFYPQEYFTNCADRINLSYLNTALITEEVTLVEKERLYYMHNPIEFEIETASKFPMQVMNLNTPNVSQKFGGFVADFPVKMINWLYRSVQFENENDSTYFLHRYNFSSTISTNDQDRLFYQFMEKTDFILEGQNIVDKLGTADFYRYLQTLKSGMFPTEKNIYSYAMSLYPNKMSPSGSLNFSETNSNKTFLQFRLTPQPQIIPGQEVDISMGATLHGYGYGYNILKIHNNSVFRLFS